MQAETRVYVLDKEGRIKNDSFLSEFENNTRIIRLSKKDHTLDRITRYFHLAFRDTNSLDFSSNLYKIEEAMRNEFQAGRVEVAKELGISEELLNRIGNLTCDGKYDLRHSPKQGMEVETMTESEIEECIKSARGVVLFYVKILPQKLGLNQ
ncbi:hypothetical protein JXM67_08845 [candidate division WOR-3 bacterium]|nr:hypothetical protein [candidate division WOR-3 bacterium]